MFIGDQQAILAPAHNGVVSQQQCSAFATVLGPSFPGIFELVFRNVLPDVYPLVRAFEYLQILG